MFLGSSEMQQSRFVSNISVSVMFLPYFTPKTNFPLGADRNELGGHFVANFLCTVSDFI